MSTSPRHLCGPLYEFELAAPEPSGGGSAFAPAAVRCVGPTGRALSLGAFADGGIWRARLAANVPGEWRWEAGGETGTLVVPKPAMPAETARWPRSPLRMSPDRRYLVDATGAPFLFCADTAWFIVEKGTPDEWACYLDRRAAQGFRVTQVSLLPFAWDRADADGNFPFLADDLGRPNPAFFRRFDVFCRMAAGRGICVCLVLIWGGPRQHLPASRFTTEQAVNFARYAVARYGAFPMLWSLSGDARYVEELEKWETVGAAVEAADPYGNPTTNHLPSSLNWHALHHASDWHDFHMIQTGHQRSAIPDVSDLPFSYYRREPIKACVNGESWYEAHPERRLDSEEDGPIFTSSEVRFAFWMSVLSGATMGHTYGGQGIWNWKRPGDSEAYFAGPQVGPLWSQALDHPGAVQCGLGAGLLRRGPWWRLRPAPERCQLDPMPAAARRPVCAIADGEAWLIYLPDGAGRLTLKGLESIGWRARWFDPRTGAEELIGPATPDQALKWRAPAAPSPEDWVLVLTAG